MARQRARRLIPMTTGVRRYASWHEVVDEPVHRWETPTGGISVILSFGPAMRVSSASASGPTTVTSFVVGMYDEPALTEHDGVGLGVQVDLTAAGAFALLGVTMDELANRAVPAADVCRLDVDGLVDRLLGVPSWPERTAILDETLSRSMDSGPRLSPEVGWVDAQLRAHPETARIGDLAEEIGWGRSRLVDRFRREVGLPPKTVARVLRYRRAVSRLTSGTSGPSGPSRPSGSLADLAAASGYADQAHFNRDFRAFSSMTPTEFLASLG
jgi:AraC-like DNA-binding protein